MERRASEDCRSTRKKKNQKRWTEQSSFIVERDVMVGAYSVRKLLEARKVSDRLANQVFTVRSHALIGRAPDLYNRFEFWENYNVQDFELDKLPLWKVCNQVIHSWNWGISADEHTGLFDGIFISSDHQRRSCLYFIDVDTFVNIFKDIGDEQIVGTEMRRNSKGEMEYINITGVSWSQLVGDGVDGPEQG